jgi:hypothetical protein
VKSCKKLCTLILESVILKLFCHKGSKLKIGSKIKAVVDTGYVGIARFHADSLIPIRRSEKRSLNREDKVFN